MKDKVEDALTIALLLLFLTHFYIPILQPVQSSLFAAASDDQTGLGQAITMAVWLLALALMLRSYRTVLAAWRSSVWVLAFASFAVFSAVWSQDAGITLRKSCFLLLTTVFGIYFARSRPVEHQMALICKSAAIAALLSIAFAFFLPRYGIDHDAHEGVWLGIFTQKNVCAREMLFLLVTVLPMQLRTSRLKLIRGFAIAAIITVIIGTQSKTALLIMVAFVLIFPTLALYRRMSQGVVFVTMTGAIALASFVCVFSASALPQLILLLGRDGTFTGRTAIWQAVMHAITKHPLLGYGFAAFWLSLRGESANIILALHWAVPAAHNGFLDIWLQLGTAGLLLFFAGFLVALRSSVHGLRQPSFARAAWPFAVLILTLVYNLDESSLMQPNDFLWVIYVATLTNLAAPIQHRRVALRSVAAASQMPLQSVSFRISP